MIQSFAGLLGAARPWFLASQLTSERLRHTPSLVITQDRPSARQLIDELRFFSKELSVIDLPAWETLPFERVAPQGFLAARRIAALDELRSGRPVVIVSHAAALITQIPQPELLFSPTIALAPGDEISKTELKERLLVLGYKHVSLVEDPGQFAVRGGIIDFFPATTPLPVRCEFLAGSLHQLRLFEPTSQRSKEECRHVSLTPVSEFVLYPFRGSNSTQVAAALQLLKERAEELGTPPSELSKILDALRDGRTPPGGEFLQSIYLPMVPLSELLPQKVQVILVNELGVTQALDSAWEVAKEREVRLARDHYLIPRCEQILTPPERLLTDLKSHLVLSLDQLETVDSLRSAQKQTKIVSYALTELTTRLKTAIGSGEGFRPLQEAIEVWRRKEQRLAFVIGSEQRARRLHRILLDLGYDAPIKSDLSGLEWCNGYGREPITILLGHLAHGAQIPDEKIVFIAESEIFGERSYRKAAQAETNIKKLLGSLSQLKENDYVVHADYGIGIYRGFSHKDVDGQGSDLLQIEYADSMLYLPLTSISKVQRFSGSEGQVPSIDKLSSKKWEKTKEKIRKSVVTLAGDLIRLYAAREVAEGYPFEAPNADDEIFADGFAYNETEDQLKAIDETLDDMSQAKPMDRLVCGDVGFGKTEIALRAAYKAVQHSKQVAVLAPTTILADQHRETFQRRFQDFPVRIGAVSRLYSRQANKETLEKASSGKIDIIIGTHRLIQSDVRFHDLGLLIIDEEHRFGVKQKERLKAMRKQIDVLSLTATPIPRTLHMSLLGLRDMSLITTPPVDRRVVRTYVANEDEGLVRDAIVRELQRGGQCFFLNNRVQNIELITSELRDLVPEARFEFAHGQMQEQQLEQIMLRFLEREIDVLVCTTIIESGIDIPNANTILINRADTLGLAQLYQLRGRVGRSSRQAYCYFLVPKTKKLSTEAQERLRALQALDDLGLGFHLAMRDLEIRGAGNLLGKEQSGNVLAVGFELYTKILKEAIHNLTGSELLIEESVDPEVKIEVNAFVPDFYIPDISERLILYQRLSAILTEDESHDLVNETADRFGPLPDEVEALFDLMTFRGLIRRFGVVRADFSPARIILSFSPEAPLDPDKIFALVSSDSDSYRMSQNNSLTVTQQGILEMEPPRVYRAMLRLLDKLVKE